MRPDQERVKNLLIDTVTLLCKNSVHFEDELHVEGLLGVSVDHKDVFFVHISKEFTNSPSGGATVTESQEDTPTDKEDEKSDPKDHLSNDQISQEEDSQPGDPNVSIKQEAIEEEEEECLIVEDPHIKLEGVAQPAQMIAGQRRALKRSHHPHGHGSMGQQHSQEDQYGDNGSVMGMGGDSQDGYSPYGHMRMDSGEPPTKHRPDDPEGYSVQHGGHGNNSEETPWPGVAGVSEFDTSGQHQTFHDSGDSQLSMSETSQPGCSSWSTPRGPSDSVTYLSCEDGEVALMLEQPEKSFDQLPSHSALLPQTYNIGQHIHQGHFTSAAKDKKHQCSVCGASFVLKGNLRLHLVTHTGERPFMCSVCQKTFNRKNNMERHMTMIHRMSITQKKT